MRKRGLYWETFGQGDDLVLVHGWGMHSGVWRDFVETLAQKVRVTVVDLPGHGRSGDVGDFSLTNLADVLLTIAPEHAHWLGWSLGALPVLHIADRCPSRAKSVIIMAGNARFVAENDWPGVDPALLAQFASDLEGNYEGTIRRFLGLQTFGMENSRLLVKELAARVTECEPPDQAALRGGLSLLRHADLRDALRRLTIPSLVILGARDRLVPKAAGASMQALNFRSELHVIDGAAHLPFITHPAETASLVTNFIARHDGR
ncbi:pimeloyl-ACP methyl ester esterase BioH [Methylocaldum sp.]|uniref:pimeloyl-ACP methyl ester esterase BioH n=1 Tax=Methylocaldum sp. TaxID=1969727 RepID=UPI002D233E59|nr:pimeloyl-ACP methyl ester esterase BioH [Methylocaldum sp.]HYE36162.1 pimeloyl-ACP methyl ester esterase BioH [Methylocaldum sp.]